MNIETRRITLVVTAVVLFLAAVTVSSGVGYKFWTDRRTEQARAASSTVAQRTLEAIFTYDYHTVDTELPKAANNLTPSFRGDYLTLITKDIAPAAKQKELTVRATAEAVGVISTQPSHAVVLVYLNQVTTGKDSPQGSVLGTRVRVSLDKDGGQWLVGKIDPI
ncbi:h domain protein [Nocardia sp. alder85J]|uniref:h domain protein n=1 Tax=Nocardia sp. alder85J TaxID=2862949 RepID=UPI001CD3A24B|nr:h domain protein [Nocardia sp. alder85J]MCX4093422.1 h domain protein [Nocardia sp. alder85J]